MYRIFEIIFDTADKVKLMAALPGMVAELAERADMPEDHVAELTHDMFVRGAIEKKEGRYQLIPDAIWLLEATAQYVMEQPPEVGQKLFELWHKVGSEEMPNLIDALRESGMEMQPLQRTLPVERAVKAQNTVLDVDSARKIVQEADTIVLIPCVCRELAKRNGEGKDCPAPDDSVCLWMNTLAADLIERGIGEKITNEDALRRLKISEEAGLVHMVYEGETDETYLCNCCSCCCGGFRFSAHDLGFLYAPSRFQAQINVDACDGCSICEERCQFNAITVDDVAEIDLDRCFGCGNCVITCPTEALTLVEVHPKEHIVGS